MLSFTVNDYITLKFENNKTIIYIKGEKFKQCKYLLLDISPDEISFLGELGSIDEIAYEFNHSIETNLREKPIVPPEVEFWGHCSNLQVWAENDYDSRLLLSTLAFPLLKRLTEVGDSLARIKFKESLVQRFLSYDLNVARFLIEEGYFSYLNNHEVMFLLGEIKEGIVDLPLNKQVCYLELLARSGIEILGMISSLYERIKDLSFSEVFDLLDIDISYNSKASDFFKLLLDHPKFSKIFFDSITDSQFDLQSKAIRFLSAIKDVGASYLVNWFPFAVKKLNSRNFKSYLYELYIHKTSISPSYEMIEFIVNQLVSIEQFNLKSYNMLMEILDGIKYLLKTTLSIEKIEIFQDEFYLKFDKYFKDLNYSFVLNDTLEIFKYNLIDSCFYYDLIQERLPSNDFFRGENDAYRKLREIIFPKSNFLIFDLWKDDDLFIFSISIPKIPEKILRSIMSFLKNKRDQLYKKNFRKELQNILKSNISNYEKLIALYNILDFLVYEKHPFEIRFIDSDIFNERVSNKEAYYKVEWEDKRLRSNSFETIQKVFFPDENLKLLDAFMLESYVFYVVKT